MASERSDDLRQQVLDACEHNTPLHIIGGNSKAFFAPNIKGEPLLVNDHQGIVAYEPTELVLTARAGTTLHSIEKSLDEQGQMLGFEPPAYGASATLGGTIAANLSGPRRAYTGAARDFVLGCKLLNGKGEILSFGGEVMKNVAGYDVSRLMAGALGTLGVLLEVSLKVLPKPEMEKTCVLECSPLQALDKIHIWGQQPLPISASCYYDSQLAVRFSGAEKAVNAAVKSIGGDTMADADNFWLALKEQKMPFFSNTRNLWRLSLASDAQPLSLPGQCIYEWGGALRWLSSDEPGAAIRSAVQAHAGHATLFRYGEMLEHNHDEVFQPLPASLLRIHQKLKHAFDPQGILNPGKLYDEL